MEPGDEAIDSMLSLRIYAPASVSKQGHLDFMAVHVVKGIAIVPCSGVELELEAPLQTAMLFSLVGAGCFVANQWHATVKTNVERMNAMIKGK